MLTKATNLEASSENYSRIISLASLFRGVFSIDWLVELSGEAPSHILINLEQAVREGLLKSNGPAMYDFSDPGHKKRLSESFSREEKRAWHRQIADLFSRILPEGDHKSRLVAYHLFQIPNDENDCRKLLKGGDAYRRDFDNKDALSCYRKVLETLTVSSSEEADSLYIEAAIKYSKISTARSKPTNSQSILYEAMTRAKRWHKQNYEALLNMHLAKNEWLRARYDKALSTFEEAWSLARKSGDPRVLRTATTFSTFFLYWQGRFREVITRYENAVPDIEKYPSRRFPLLAALNVGHCYVQIGNVTQGLGMIDAIHKQCQEQGDRYLAAYAGATMGMAMLDTGRTREAIDYLKQATQDAMRAENDWIRVVNKLTSAIACYLVGNKQEAISFLQGYLKDSRKLQIRVQPYPHLLELCWAMEQGALKKIDDLSLEKQIGRLVRGKNVFMKGVAYRYRALVQNREGLPSQKVIRSLKRSLEWLNISGQQLEQIKTKIELARQYLMAGEKEKAKKIIRDASSISYPLGESLIPDELKSLVKERPLGESLIREILQMSQEVITIRNNKDLVKHIISTANRITGAERGAIFLIDEKASHPKVALRASINLTPSQIDHESFSKSLKMIEEVMRSGKGRILETRKARQKGTSQDDIIRSRICVPMILRNEVVGVLYNDTRLFSSAFRNPDLEILSYFASQAAFAMDNTQAYEQIRRLNQKLEEEKKYLEEQHLQAIHFEDIYGESPAIRHVLDQVNQVAQTDATVLILGETGVGKELVARAIHYNSPRRSHPFIRVHCSALPESLILSELFGHEKGAFTGATHRKIGRFELAHEGSIFLDEVGDISPNVQVSLLRVLQSKEFERVGGSKTIRSDFRLIAATNRDIEHDVTTGKFRADLFYRINVVPIYIPPLRDRKEDIPILAHYFIKLYSVKIGKHFHKISDEEMEKLMQYDWPGNVRELENIIERSTILSHEPILRIPEINMDNSDIWNHKEGNWTLKENERRHILRALQRSGWKVRGPRGAAELLEINPSTLEFKMKKLGIRRPAKRVRNEALDG